MPAQMQRLSILVLNVHGLPVARRIGAALHGAAEILAPADVAELAADPSFIPYAVPAAQQMRALLQEGTPVLAVGSVETVVRLIAADVPGTPPAMSLLAIDETGRFVVPILSDGLGSAGALAARLAAQLGATAALSGRDDGSEPPALVVGVGAEKGVPAEDFEAAVTDVLRAHGLPLSSVATIATLDRRAVEEGFATWISRRQWPLLSYTAEQLAQVQPIPTPSEIVAQAVGTPGVCEPAAMLAAGSQRLLVPKHKHGRVTVAVAQRNVAVDRGRGRLTIVGIGPGAPDLLTVRATRALAEAEVLVGYERYLQRLGPLVAGKELQGSAIGRESERAQLAIELARQGRRAAVISSGDAGIYGMAGLVFAALEAQGWHPGQAPDVEVIPGVSAAQAAASLLGAPLANDFAVLSLSDLLKPRDVVAQRLEALAAADVVLTLYNPQSQQRRELFQQACHILLRHRPPGTPVAVVRAASREGQTIHLGELGELAQMPVDMESLVVVGNSQTQRFGDNLLTARGGDRLSSPDPPSHTPSAAPTPADSQTGEARQPVLFVGAGPGDPELLTLRGARALASADVVVYAGSLVPRGVLAHVRPGTQLHNSATLTLEETHRLLAEAYRAGQQAVRLHSGDPSLYGAITEQMDMLDQDDIPYDIIPGVSAFQAVAARLGVEYTQPEVVQTIILTRAGGRTGLPPNESLADLARHGVTLCIFLSARHVAEVQQTLLSSYAPTTPVAVAYRATWPDEEITTGRLADLVDMVQRPGYDRTTLIIVGPSLARQGKRSHLYDPSYQHLFRPGRGRQRESGNQGSATS